MIKQQFAILDQEDKEEPVDVEEEAAAMSVTSAMEELASDPESSQSASDDDSDVEPSPSKKKRKSTPQRTRSQAATATPSTFRERSDALSKRQQRAETPTSPFLGEEYPLYDINTVPINDAAAIIMGVKIVQKERITRTGTFVVDSKGTSYAPSEWSIDGVGIWGKPSTQSAYFNIEDQAGGQKTLTREKYSSKVKIGDYSGIKITASRYLKPDNKSGSRYRKTIIKGFKQTGGKEMQIPRVVIHYSWKGAEGTRDDIQVNTTARVRESRHRIHQKINATRIEAPVQAQVYKQFMETWDCERWPIYSEEMFSFEIVSDIILGVTAVEADEICNSIPQGFRSAGVSVLDLDACEEKELTKDGNGRYSNPQGDSWYFSRSSDTGKLKVLSKKKRPDSFDAQVSARRFSQADVTAIYNDSKLIRKIYIGKENGLKRRLAVIQYYWMGQEVLFEVGDEEKHTEKQAKKAREMSNAHSEALDN